MGGVFVWVSKRKRSLSGEIKRKTSQTFVHFPSYD